MSHDIHTDAEFWELRELYTDRAGFVWLEMLAIADRNDGRVGPDSEHTVAMLASRCRTSRAKVASVLNHGCAKGWLTRNPHIQVVKFAEYHRTRVPNKTPSEPSEPDPSEPSLRKDTIMSAKADLTVQDLVDSWNGNFDGKLPKVEWPLSKSRYSKAAMRLKEHTTLQFWQKVFDNIAASPFLLGAGNGQRDWRCTLDFIIKNDTNCIKIYEGAYLNGQ